MARTSRNQAAPTESEAKRALIEAAVAARLRAYAPYSRFLVGAAVRDETGRISSGCNVENAAYPIGICAETAALAAMVLAGGTRAHEVVIVGPRSAGLVTPCGGCRQRLREFGAPDLPIHICDEDGELLRDFTLEELLPASFGPENLSARGSR
jgi:cytidine deaminase